VADDGHSLKKVIVDFTDSSLIDSNALDWCDVYGKINLDATQTASDKIVCIGPSFGIQIYNLPKTLWYAITNFLKSYPRIPNKRRFFSDYKSQYKRPKLTDYHPQPSKTDYIFFMASLWKQEAETNSYRANFINSCQANSNVTFEGGFAPRTKDDIRGFEDLTTSSRISMNTYLNNTKTSALVFNTPTVKGCHGWKLAEYLCLGKAIISTPLSRVLPGPLNNKEHLIYTNGIPEDISEKIDAILMNPSLKHRLETQAKQYFERHLLPKVVIERLLAH
jgi:glycosyltransferase involved in cell wall biosynthesis